MIEYGKPPLPLNVQRWSQLMRKLGVVKGDNVVSELHQQVFPVVVLEDDRPEHKFAAGERLAWGQYLLAAAGAGIVGYVGLQNPAGSGVILVVTRAQAFPDSASGSIRRYYHGLARAAVVTLQFTEQPRDTRWQPSGAFGTAAPNIAGQIISARSDTIATLPFATGELVSAFSSVATQSAAFVAPLEEPVILAPGDQLFLWGSDGNGGTVPNVRMQASFYWRERTLEPGET
jgi:hypothetical protein